MTQEMLFVSCQGKVCFNTPWTRMNGHFALLSQLFVQHSIKININLQSCKKHQNKP